jgi:predicted nucleic acid-binding protein
MTMPVVVDASALVELLLQSERAPAVLQAVGRTEMVAPDGINPEVLSALRRLERIGELSAGRARQAIDDLLDAAVRRLPTLPLLPDAWMLRANVTSYDACYVALARNLGCPLITGDLRLSRAPELGVPLIIV